MKNYYKILEVSETASIEVIEKAYKVLVKKYHPDLQGDTLAANKKIKEINEAHDVLTDSFLKEQYDKELQNEKYERTIPRRQIPTNEQEPQESSNGLVLLVKTIFSHKPNFEGIKNIKKIDIIALILTIIIVIGIGLILYILPFTHDWMNENFVDTPIINWIRGLF